MSDPMTPEQAREQLEVADYPDMQAVLDHALETIAAMTTESDYRVVPHETIEGRYETRRYERHVTEWQEVPRD